MTIWPLPEAIASLGLVVYRGKPRAPGERSAFIDRSRPCSSKSTAITEDGPLGHSHGCNGVPAVRRDHTSSAWFTAVNHAEVVWTRAIILGMSEAPRVMAVYRGKQP